jgi:hypothetical protein
MILVYRYRVKSLNGMLNRQSGAVSYVWNFCNDMQKHALKWSKKWPTGFDLNGLTSGRSQDLGLHSGTVNATGEQYANACRFALRIFIVGALAFVASSGWIAALHASDQALSDAAVVALARASGSSHDAEPPAQMAGLDKVAPDLALAGLRLSEKGPSSCVRFRTLLNSSM